MTTLLDCAGGSIGGFRRYLDELDHWSTAQHVPLFMIGHGRPLSGTWALAREWKARELGAHQVLALNNLSFMAAGDLRAVLLRNALHFLYGSELLHRRRLLLPELTRGVVVRAALRRAHRIIVPSASMAERVRSACPDVLPTVEVLHHPVRPRPSTGTAAAPWRVLCPVVDGPHKCLQLWLGDAILALDEVRRRGKSALSLEVTISPAGARANHLPAPPWVCYIGPRPPTELARHQDAARVIFYPADVESFGYPLAEARVNRQPVVAPDSPLTREVAGDALVPYRRGDQRSLRHAFERAFDLTLPPLASNPFDPSSYFPRLLQPVKVA